MGKKVEARPYYAVRHEYDAALKNYQNAASMLHSAVRSVISIAERNPAAAPKLIEELKKHADAFQQSAYGED